MSQSENGAGNGEYLSIGEVLALLQQEFSDIKISKIRFLEAQGLINPERTSAGFRRFYPHDVEQLRWILAQQRDNFLPLKVIKARLDDGEAPIAVTQPHLWEHDEAPPPAVAPAKPHDSASPTPAVSAQANGAGPPSGSPRRDAAQWLASLQEQPLRQSKRSFSTSVAPSDLAQVEGLAFS